MAMTMIMIMTVILMRFFFFDYYYQFNPFNDLIISLQIFYPHHYYHAYDYAYDGVHRHAYDYDYVFDRVNDYGRVYDHDYVFYVCDYVAFIVYDRVLHHDLFQSFDYYNQYRLPLFIFRVVLI